MVLPSLKIGAIIEIDFCLISQFNPITIASAEKKTKKTVFFAIRVPTVAPNLRGGPVCNAVCVCVCVRGHGAVQEHWVCACVCR